MHFMIVAVLGDLVVGVNDDDDSDMTMVVIMIVEQMMPIV